jgi:DNA-binding NarL/FixJ family response regulator
MIPAIKESSPDSKIILVSSFFTLKEIEQIILNQADHFILKPSLTKEKIHKLLDVLTISEKKGVSFWTALKKIATHSQKNKISNIAIVEDDEVFSYQLKHFLENEAPNQQVNTFDNQKDFFEYSFTEDPELIFLDYYLNDGTGNQIIKKIKAMNWNPKIIIISSQENTHIVSDLHKQGITGYIIKDHEWKTHLSQYLALLSF